MVEKERLLLSALKCRFLTVHLIAHPADKICILFILKLCKSLTFRKRADEGLRPPFIFLFNLNITRWNQKGRFFIYYAAQYKRNKVQVVCKCNMSFLYLEGNSAFLTRTSEYQLVIFSVMIRGRHKLVTCSESPEFSGTTF